MKIQSFRDLRIWQEAHSLTLAVYKETKAFPIEERFGLTAQIRRSATSVAANIAEGMGRRSTADYLRFLYMALGSAQETLYHSILANDLGYFSPEIAKSLVERYGGLSAGLQAAIKKLASLKQTTKPLKY